MIFPGAFAVPCMFREPWQIAAVSDSHSPTAELANQPFALVGMAIPR